MDADAVFPRTQIIKGDNEMTIAELRQTAAENAAHGGIDVQPALHDPAEVLAAGGLPRPGADRPGARRQQPQGRQAGELRARHRRHLRLLRAAVLVARRGARRAACRPGSRRGSPNIVLGAAGVALLVWRARRPTSRFASASRRSGGGGETAAAAGGAARRAVAAPPARRGRRPHPAPRLAAADAARRLRLAPVPARLRARRSSRCSGIFYISTFIDLADKLFRGAATTAHAAALLLFRRRRSTSTTSSRWRRWSRRWSPSALLTKNSELLVMRACGISLYRSALPLLLFAVLVSVRAVRDAGAGAGRTPTAKPTG